MIVHDQRNGSPYDRGRADSYYRRRPIPHYYQGSTGEGKVISEADMTAEEIQAYWDGYYQSEEEGDYKDYA